MKVLLGSWMVVFPMAMVHAGGSQNITTTTNTRTTVPNPANHTIITGHGSSFASSCQAALWEWETASADLTIIGSSSAIVTYTYSQPGLAPVISASRLVTLCDGHPRAVGSASELPFSITNTVTETYTLPPTAIPSPTPCSIGPADCANLYKAYNALLSAAVPPMTSAQTFSAPPCATNESQSFLFSSAVCGQGWAGIKASSVQLLYWPIRTVENSDYFCNYHSYTDIVTPRTLSGTPTGSGPNTFVTGSLTITSPTIALSFSALSRVDNCGRTIDHTIITLLPDQLTSVRGARALYDWQPFNYGDLNWMCSTPDNTTFTIQDVGGPNCYQNVPAQAYWSDAIRYDRATNGRDENSAEQRGWTMMNDYQPHIIPAQSVWLESIHSIWGTSAAWFIDGTWDPPIALQEAASVAKPTLPSTASASPTPFTYVAQSQTAPPTPAQLGDAIPSPTVVPHPPQVPGGVSLSKISSSSAVEVSGVSYVEPSKSGETAAPEPAPAIRQSNTIDTSSLSVSDARSDKSQIVEITSSTTYIQETTSGDRAPLPNAGKSSWGNFSNAAPAMISKVRSTALGAPEPSSPAAGDDGNTLQSTGSMVSGTATTSGPGDSRIDSSGIVVTSGISSLIVAILLCLMII